MSDRPFRVGDRVRLKNEASYLYNAASGAIGSIREIWFDVNNDLNLPELSVQWDDDPDWEEQVWIRDIDLVQNGLDQMLELLP